ncbi:MAG TPA: serine/threonine-protein kinase [Kofleriaceae bacterium]|jgi:serine/threonine-protein kinase
MIQVGQTLDKYELLERVGQGGMAVVYRGIDRSLKRVVAIKVLHRHLSDYQEARDRFEREAQAVAKLRHENILEIFDFAAKESESYIVTEFIDGQTLKQAISERPIAYPEVGAMIMLQVARALAHAHAAGILHRDIKPENIMVRSDGVVKLMDFGISHMVDLERLTVTGQLLGSPAYMAPEHVEGRPLDFRTDVFAVGIVLYQLAVGKLPFEGKNPHEVLKRIAECKFVDPRQANPRIGNRLGRVILRAMAAAPDDRFPTIGEMVLALEGYLVESGLAPDKIAAELARYFAGPAAYEQALHDRLVDHLARRGRELLETDRAAALDVFDRVLTIDPKNARVLEILDGLARKKRIKSVAIGAGVAAALALGAWGVHRQTRPPPQEVPSIGGRIAYHFAAHDEGTSNVIVPPVPVDAGATQMMIVLPDAPREAPHLDAAVAEQPLLRIKVVPAHGTRVRIGDDPTWYDVPDEGSLVRPLAGDSTVYAENPCCVAAAKPVRAGQSEVDIGMSFAPARLVLTCDAPGAKSVTVDGAPAQLGGTAPVFFPKDTLLDERTVVVEFVTTAKVDRQEHRVHAGQTVTVTCAP